MISNGHYPQQHQQQPGGGMMGGGPGGGMGGSGHIPPPPGLNREMSESTWETFTDYDNHAQQEHIARLHMLCDAASEENEDSWNAIREWLESNRHNQDVLLAGAETLGDYATTPLHLACRNCPPADVVHRLLEIAPNTVRMTDSFSWLPLHYACANGASVDVLRILAERYPDSKTASDKRGRTPLHFALGNTQRPASPEVVELLVESGAAGCPDENGMLPLHYACAYGISQEALEVLTASFMESITRTDNKGRTPLHFALGNADRAASPSVVKHLLSQKVEIVNITDKDGQLPLHLLSTQAGRLTADQKDEMTNAQKCLELYLQSEPQASADFFTALQSLPRFLRDVAVVTPLVQHILNNKISRRFPTMILMLDFYFIVLIIVFFRSAIRQMIDILFETHNAPSEVNNLYLFPLYLGGIYFLTREVVQVISLASLGLFKTWIFDVGNLLDVGCIFIVFFWTIVMSVGYYDPDAFRSGTAISTGCLFLLVLSFLKSTLIDFAVFVGGVFYVVNRLAAFLMALAVILIAFAQMFVTVFQGSCYCACLEEPDDSCPSKDENGVYQNCTPVTDEITFESYRPFCNIWESLLKVYTMLLGEVSEEDFRYNAAATWLFIIFMFLVVILLANVLIAIVTDSYGVIRNERAQIVFWSNRLDFVAEIDLISTGPWMMKLTNFFCCGSDSDKNEGDAGGNEGGGSGGANNIGLGGGVSRDNSRGSGLGSYTNSEGSQDSLGWDKWKKIMHLYGDQELAVLSVEFWCCLLLRVTTALFIIPSWLMLGLATAGFFWPPQVREYLFVQRITKRQRGDTLKEQRVIEMEDLRSEVQKLQDEIREEMVADRKEVDIMKTQLTQMKAEMTTEMKQIKEIMTMLFDLQSSG